MGIIVGTGNTLLKVFAGEDEIENVFVGEDLVFVNETMITVGTPSGYSLQSGSLSQQGKPGESFTTVEFRRTAASGQRFTGSPVISITTNGSRFQSTNNNANVLGSHGTISVVASIVGTGAGNYVRITVSGNFQNQNYDITNITVTGLTTQTQRTFTYTFTGNLGRSTSCTTFGSSCTVSSSTTRTVVGQFFRNNATGTGGYGRNGTTQGCSRSISSSGGSSSCSSNTSAGSYGGPTLYAYSTRAGNSQFAAYFSNSTRTADPDAVAVFRFTLSNYPGGSQQRYYSRGFFGIAGGDSFTPSTHSENTSWNPCGDAIRVRTNLGLSRTNNRYSGAQTQWNAWGSGDTGGFATSMCAQNGTTTPYTVRL